MKAMTRVLLLSILISPVAGCLLEEVAHTLILEPDGSVLWTACQKDVRSDAKTPQERDREESEFWDLVKTGIHPVAEALREIGGAEVHTAILRDRRPFSVVTTARFESAAAMAERLIAALGVPGQAELIEEARGTTLRLRLWLETADTDSGSDAAAALLADGDDWRIVLAEGKFVEAAGFTLRDGDTAATFAEVDEKALEDNGGVLDLTLTWSKAD